MIVDCQASFQHFVGFSHVIHQPGEINILLYFVDEETESQQGIKSAEVHTWISASKPSMSI